MAVAEMIRMVGINSASSINALSLKAILAPSRSTPDRIDSRELTPGLDVNSFADAELQAAPSIADSPSPRDIRLRELMAAVSQGNERAFGQLRAATLGIARHAASRVCRNRSDLDDVMQDAYLKIWRSARQYDAERSEVIPWIVKCVRNQAIDAMRRASVRAMGMLEHGCDDVVESMPVPGAGPCDTLDAEQQYAAVRRQLERLAPLQRQCLTLAYFHGHTQSEVATLMSAPLGTVKSNIRRGLEAMALAMSAPRAA